MSETVSFEVLRERFPSETINPFGEVLVIPSRRFQRGWERTLEGEGHRVFMGSYNGEVAFLVRVNKGEPRKVENPILHRRIEPRQNANSTEVTTVTSAVKRGAVDTYKRWTSREIKRLKEMLEQGLDVKEIAKTLDRTVASVVRKTQRLRKKGFDLPVTESGAVTPPSPAPSPVTPRVDEDPLIKELLAAASELYPKYRHACRFLLLETSKMIQAK